MDSVHKEILIRLCLNCCVTENRPEMQYFVMNNLDSFDSVDLEILISTVKQMNKKSERDILFLRELYKRTVKLDVDKIGIGCGFRLAYLNIVCKEHLNINVFTEVGIFQSH